MGLHTRTTKSNGTTEWAQGETITHTEHNAEWNQFLSEFNGGIDENNLDPATQIPNAYLVSIAQSKVLDNADTIAAYKATTSPGDTGSPSLPATLTEENARVRHRIGALSGYSSNVYYMNSAGTAVTASWFEPIRTGRNLIPNPGFESPLSAANAAPDGWSKVSTPTTIAIEAAAYKSEGLKKRSLNIVTGGANQGISCTVAGLKASTKYLVGMTYTLTDNGTVAGVLRLSTSNGLASGDYQNLVLDASTEAPSTVAVLQGIVKSTSVPDTMTISITATTSGGDFNLIDVWMYELQDGKPFELPYIPMQTANYTTANDLIAGGGAATWTNRSALSLSQYVPFRGYRFTYEVAITFAGPAIAGSVRKYQYAFRIQQNIDGGGATTVEGPYSWTANQQTNSEFIGGTVFLKYIIENPTPGSTYAFTTDVFVENDGADEAATMVINPTIGGGTAVAVSRARLIVERL